MTSLMLTGMPVALTTEAHAHAARLAAEQASPEIGQRVYLNTLAVWAVHTYCRWLGIATDLAQGDSWQPGLAGLLDVADLPLPGVGRVECRPVLPGEASFTVPLAAMGDRLGYVAVQFFDSLDRVELLGFLPSLPGDAAEPPTIALADLASLDGLLDALHPTTHLRQWLEGLLDAETWRSPEQLLATTRYRPAAPAPLGTVSRAKPIVLGEAAQPAVVLVVQVAASGDGLTVSLGLYPARGTALLPRQIKLAVLDELGAVLSEATAEAGAFEVELRLADCRPGEQFSVRITHRSTWAMEAFMV